MTVNDTCVSLSTGTLSPDLRVKYAQGMILGLGEFLQEQTYFLERDYRHERALHGYGTVDGLQVTIAADDADYTVTVSPGMAIDPPGRDIVVRSPQCARLGAWLQAQEQAAPGTIDAHKTSDKLTVYVVAGYDECPDNLVPVPGQPCSSGEQTKVASRLRDSWTIELRWDPPPMPAWDTDRRLARLLSSVQIVAGLDSSQSSEALIIDAVRALPAQADAGPFDDEPLPGSSFKLPAETAAGALDRIFTVWVTEVRPQLSPALTEPSDDSDPAVLLASITFTPGPVGSPPGAEVKIASCEDPVPYGRPYLLHTRLIQEMRWLGQAAAAAVVANGQELATLTSAIDGQGRVILTAWFHLDKPVSLTGPIQVASRSGPVVKFEPSAAPGPNGTVPKFSSVWILTPAAKFPAVDRDQVAVTFEPAKVFVGDDATTLAARVAAGLDLIDTMPDGTVAVYGTVDVPPQVVERQSPPPMEFVTITPLVGGEKPEFELWFHPQPSWPTPRAVLADLDLLPVKIFDESTGDRVAFSQDGRLVNNVVKLAIDPVKAETTYLRLTFSAAEIPVVVDDGPPQSLEAWMAAAGFAFLDWDPATRSISAYARLAGAK